MPVINGVYLKDFTALPGAVADADIIPIAITGDNVAYRTTVAGIVTDARITAKLLTGLSVTGGAVIAADTILEAFGKVQNQIKWKAGDSYANYDRDFWCIYSNSKHAKHPSISRHRQLYYLFNRGGNGIRAGCSSRNSHKLCRNWQGFNRLKCYRRHSTCSG
jgi:hypothetical protein